MEFLIPGLILVALMIYASTRIKRTAAAAFDEEAIETDEFYIQKPAGFLHNLNGDPAYIFDAYSKEYSKEDPKLRLGTVTIRKEEGISLDDGIRRLYDEGYVDQGSEVLGDIFYREASIEHSYVAVHRFAKLCKTRGSLYELIVHAAKEASDKQWVETFIDSFRVK